MHNNLFLNRLIIVTDEGKTAYDELFHRGVNIIHGQNSSGKSTIVRFIFFALGGSYGDFVPEALRCRYVMAEVEINGNVYTLKRYLEKTDDGKRVNKKASMYIYFGPIEDVLNLEPCAVGHEHLMNRSNEANNLEPETWKMFPYNTTANRRSFSNVLFELLRLPEVKEGSNITMHQILRLIYLDQESPLSSLFFFEQFDQPFTRETVAELLMGLYDSQLSDAKLNRIKLEGRIDELKQSIKITGQFLDNPVKQSPAFLQQQIETLKQEINAISDEVRQLRNAQLSTQNSQLSTDSKLYTLNSKLEYERLQAQVSSLRQDLVTTENEIARLKADIQDSNYFIRALQQKIEAVDRSIATREYFDKLHLEYCPECLSPIDTHVEEGRCPLCKSEIDNSKGKSQAMRIKLEMQFQIRESQQLLDYNNEQLKQHNDRRAALRREVAEAQAKYDYAVRNVRSTHDERIDELIQTKGYKEGEIAQFLTLLESAEKYQRLKQELAAAEQERDNLNRYISAAEQRIRQQRALIERTIRDNGLYLLKNDQARQDEFGSATSLTLDYAQNIIYLDDGHTKLSASSSFYLKMAARFAFFLASVQVDSMMYPRFFLSDNMEDKGMEENRSRNFQNILVRRLKELEAKKHTPETCNLKPETIGYQVIFATSNIANELNKPEYTVGDYYSQANKSLKNV